MELDTIYKTWKARRSVRSFSREGVPEDVIHRVLEVAHSAPSGANLQPWHFSVIRGAELKRQVRLEAEAVERQFYQEHAPEEWIEALKPLGTGPDKKFLEEASTLIIVSYRVSVDGKKTYYPRESTGLAVGFLLTALQFEGVSSLTHTPRPMSFLNQLLGLDETYRPYMIVAAGYPSQDWVPLNLSKRPLGAATTFL